VKFKQVLWLAPLMKHIALLGRSPKAITPSEPMGKSNKYTFFARLGYRRILENVPPPSDSTI
jgi:hypothetical protein